MLVAFSEPRRLGAARDPPLRFVEAPKVPHTWAGRRILTVDGEAAFELSFWCGTCPYLFERIGTADQALSLEGLADRLSAGLDDLDEEVIDRFAALLEEGMYLPMLLQLRPRLTGPGDPADYFTAEQPSTWGPHVFDGQSHDPRTPYYRTFTTTVSRAAHLYEFIVPMVPPAANDPVRVAELNQPGSQRSKATAVAVATLDICAPAVDDGSGDIHSHCGLTHFLLDGHHKVHAAAQSGSSVRLLSLISVDYSLATRADIEQLPTLLQQADTPRVPDTASKAARQLAPTLVGLSVGEANRRAAAAGVHLLTVEGVAQAGSEPGRITAWVRDGVIVRAYPG